MVEISGTCDESKTTENLLVGKDGSTLVVLCDCQSGKLFCDYNSSFLASALGCFVPELLHLGLELKPTSCQTENQNISRTLSPQQNIMPSPDIRSHRRELFSLKNSEGNGNRLRISKKIPDIISPISSISQESQDALDQIFMAGPGGLIAAQNYPPPGGFIASQNFPPPPVDPKIYTHPRFAPASSRVLPEAVYKVIYQDFSGGVGRNWIERETIVNAGYKDQAYVGGYNIQKKTLNWMSQNGPAKVAINFNGILDVVSVGIWNGFDGIRVSRGNFRKATAIDVFSKNFELGLISSLFDREYGVRTRVGEFSFEIRHDFDEYIVRTDNQLATEVLFGWNTLGVGIGTDIEETKYTFTYEYRDFLFEVERDFEEKESALEGEL
eukprot:GHVP01068761.1.p1 GENE.GHVP01068761.1~~GHVP01068761.1.p1  ORF type:complete len:382 (+),score=68.10 GHVP01068761.1:155-1300(+)